MGWLTRRLFDLWLLLLPVSWVAAAYTGFTAPDKLLAPLLLLAGLLSVGGASPERLRAIGSLTVYSIAFLLTKNLSFTNDWATYGRMMWEDGVRVGYFLIPILLVRDAKDFRRAGWLALVVAIAGCISAFMVSIGFLQLPVERFEESRIGVEGLRKAIGLFPSYGDLAQYVAFAIGLAVVAPGTKRKVRRWLWVGRWAVLIAVILGLLGTQSRNVLLSGLIAVGVLWLANRLRRRSGVDQFALTVGVGALVLMLASVLGYFVLELFEVVAGFGGQYARHTVEDRLEQYKVAWDIIAQSPLLGADLETYRAMGPFIDRIHNLWLRLAAHGGLLTVIVAGALLLRVFVGVRRAAAVPEKSREARVVLAYFAAMMFSVLFYVGMGEMFWALLGVGASIGCIGPYKATRRHPASAEGARSGSTYLGNAKARVG